MTYQRGHPDQRRRLNASFLKVDLARNWPVPEKKDLRQSLVIMGLDAPAVDVPTFRDAFAIKKADMLRGIPEDEAITVE